MVVDFIYLGRGIRGFHGFYGLFTFFCLQVTPSCLRGDNLSPRRQPGDSLETELSNHFFWFLSQFRAIRGDEVAR
jgi:hypothetical protein